MAVEGQERTEQPTPKRLHDAREKGQVPRSRELNTTMIMLVAASSLLIMGDSIIGKLAQMISNGLSISRNDIYDDHAILNTLMSMAADALMILAPLFLVLVIVAFLAPMMLSGWVFSVDALRPKLEKIDPIKGMGRIFSWKGLLELSKALAKFALIGTVAAVWMSIQADSILATGYQDIQVALNSVAGIAGWAFLVFCAAMIVIALIDVPFQIWDNQRQLRMTRQEIREEHKQTEGDPLLKSRIRQLQREQATRRMMEQVATADVIVTNPSHYAVALRYDQEKMRAPVVVAMGMNLIAFQIMDRGREHGVPVIEAPPLARALYYHSEINREIPAGLYLAVAQLLAYIYQVNQYQANGQTVATPDFPIPDELRRDE